MEELADDGDAAPDDRGEVVGGPGAEELLGGGAEDRAGELHGGGGLWHTQAIATGTTIDEAGHIALLACLEALADAGATTVDLGPGGGAPGSPRHRLHPQAAPVFELFATRTPSAQRVLATAQRLRRVLA